MLPSHFRVKILAPLIPLTILFELAIALRSSVFYVSHFFILFDGKAPRYGQNINVIGLLKTCASVSIFLSNSVHLFDLPAARQKKLADSRVCFRSNRPGRLRPLTSNGGPPQSPLPTPSPSFPTGSQRPPRAFSTQSAQAGAGLARCGGLGPWLARSGGGTCRTGTTLT